MSDQPIYRKLWVGIRPRLHLLTKASAGAVYMYLLTRLNDETGQCDAAAPNVAADLGLDVKTVYRAFDLIEESGVARREDRPGTSDNWVFATLDIEAEREQTLSAKRAYPRNGSTRKTGRHPTRETGRHPTRRTGNEEETKEEETREDGASAPGGIAAPADAVGLGREADEPGSGQAPTPSATKAKRAKPKKGDRGGATHSAMLWPDLNGDDRAKVHDDKTLITLAGLLGFGPAGVRTPASDWRASQIAPGPFCWFHDGVLANDSQALDKLPDQPTREQLAGFAWYTLNRIRLDTGKKDILLPTRDDLLSRSAKKHVLGDLFETRGPEAALAHIDAVNDHFEEIIRRTRKMDYPPAPTGGLFRHKAVITHADRLAAAEGEVDLYGEETSMENYL
ncbi:MAG: hypothetical protein WBD40_04930 [Tepidisphaeraceae bacterium]